jgi:hypothetical protein
MFFQELNRGKCKAYLIDCERTQKPLLIDPIKDKVDSYIAVLAYYGFKLDYVLDTHSR